MRVIITLLLALATSACATYRPMVDTRSIDDPGLYEDDLANCQSYAHQVSPGRSAAAGAVIGAVFGAAFAAALGGDRWLIEHVAASGAVQGAAVGAGSGAGTQVDIIRNCMSERGYAVLN
jgi:hypothetical protein